MCKASSPLCNRRLPLNRLTRAFLAALTAATLAIVGLDAAPASAVASCSIAGAVLNINLSADNNNVGIIRNGASFGVNGTSLASTDCGGATINNIDTVNVTVSG